jgi:hypothetical protein
VAGLERGACHHWSRSWIFSSSFAILVALMIWYQFIASIVPGQWRLVYSLNPMVGVIDGENELHLPGLWLSLQSRASSFGLVSGTSEKWKRALPI